MVGNFAKDALFLHPDIYRRLTELGEINWRWHLASPEETRSAVVVVGSESFEMSTEEAMFRSEEKCEGLKICKFNPHHHVSLRYTA